MVGWKQTLTFQCQQKCVPVTQQPNSIQISTSPRKTLLKNCYCTEKVECRMMLLLKKRNQKPSLLDDCQDADKNIPTKPMFALT